MFKAIVVAVRDRVALSLVRRSLPSRVTGQAGRTNKECKSRVFSREHGSGGVNRPRLSCPSIPVRRIKEQRVEPEKEVRAE